MRKYNKPINISLIIATLVLMAMLSAVFNGFKLSGTLINFGNLLRGVEWWPELLGFVQGWEIKLPHLLAFITASLAFIIVRRNVKAMGFFEEVFAEFGKVTWSSRKEVMMSTWVVIVLVAIATGLLSLFDSLWGTIIAKILPGASVKSP